MSQFRLYFRYARIHMRETFQYRGWILGLLPTLLYTLTDPLEALLMLNRFGAIGGVTPARIILTYAVAVLCFGLAELVARGFDYFPGIVRSGRFDRLLVRPRSLFLQVLGEYFHLNRLSRIVGAATMATIAFRVDAAARPPAWASSLPPFAAVLMLVCAVIGGTLTYVGTFSLIATPSFWTIQPMEWINIFTNGSYQVAKVPYVHLPAWLRRMFVYVMPMFVFCFFPLAAALNWRFPGLMLPSAIGWLALPVGAAYCVLGMTVWRWGARHYRSTGN